MCKEGPRQKKEAAKGHERNEEAKHEREEKLKLMFSLNL